MTRTLLPMAGAVTCGAIAAAVVMLALDNLSGTPQQIVICAAVAVAMLVSQVVPFPYERGPASMAGWLMNGLIRAGVSLIGFGASLYIILENKPIDTHLIWMAVGGFVFGGVIGALVREFRNARAEPAARRTK